MKKDIKPIINFLFEVGILSKTPRSGFHFLGSGEQSVAEHVHRTLYAGYVLATLEGSVDMGKVMKAAQERLAGRNADGRTVSEVVKAKLS